MISSSPAAMKAALAQVDAWRNWPFGKLVLVGPEGVGKTHLAHVWAAQSGARIITARDVTEADVLGTDAALAVEDADRVAGDRAAETRLFHLHNALAQRGAAVLFTARAAVAMGRGTARSGQPDAPGDAGADRGPRRRTSVCTSAQDLSRPGPETDARDHRPCPCAHRTLGGGGAGLCGPAGRARLGSTTALRDWPMRRLPLQRGRAPCHRRDMIPDYCQVP
jgi:hypothetical protein